MARTTTPHTPVVQLIAGEFRRGVDYRNWRPRGTNDWLLIYTVSGQGKLTAADGRTWLTAAGDAALYEPHAHQEYATAEERAEPWRLRWMHFQPRPAWQPWLRWPPRAAGLRWLSLVGAETRRRVSSALVETIRWERRREVPGHLELAANALERALLWAHADQADHRSETGGWARIDERIRRAAEWLGEESRAPFSLPQLAARSGLSVSRLAHLFKAQIGVSPQQFAERRRLERACQLLRYTGLTVAEIATETGYEDAFYFSKRFRRHFGASPSQYREAAGR